MVHHGTGAQNSLVETDLVAWDLAFANHTCPAGKKSSKNGVVEWCFWEIRPQMVNFALAWFFYRSTRNLWGIWWVLYGSFELHMCHGQATWVVIRVVITVNGGMTIPELAASSSPTFDGTPGLKGLHDSIWNGAQGSQPFGSQIPSIILQQWHKTETAHCKCNHGLIPICPHQQFLNLMCPAPRFKDRPELITIIPGWWFQPLWKILVSWDDSSQYMEK